MNKGNLGIIVDLITISGLFLPEALLGLTIMKSLLRFLNFASEISISLKNNWSIFYLLVPLSQLYYFLRGDGCVACLLYFGCNLR